MKTADTKIFVAIDNSSPSRRAVDYVAKLVGRRRRFRVCLVHLLPPFPPALLEHGGSENPRRERQLEAGLRAEQKRWILTAKNAAQNSLNKASSALRKAGVPARAVQTLFCEPADGRAAAEDLFRIARKYRCRTVVAGRESVSWFHELFSQDFAQELLRCGKGFSVWVIE